MAWPPYSKVEDWFAQNVHDKICISGSKTLISQGPVYGEENIVLTSMPNKIPSEDKVKTDSGDIKEILFALSAENPSKDIICVGGATTINTILPWANNIFMCKLDLIVDGDTLVSPSTLSYIQSTFALHDLQTVNAIGNEPKLEFYHYKRSVH